MSDTQIIHGISHLIATRLLSLWIVNFKSSQAVLTFAGTVAGAQMVGVFPPLGRYGGLGAYNEKHNPDRTRYLPARGRGCGFETLFGAARG